ncbi:MAG: hypothetical protein J2P30_12795 [Actinobacteria bacterium]|nr:hypothetical protein [Actinomycetota bacterium]
MVEQPGDAAKLAERSSMVRYWLLDRFVIILRATARGGIDLAHTPAGLVYGLFMAKVEFSFFIDKRRHTL